MKVSEAFLVNTSNFENIINALVNYDKNGDPIIDAQLMHELEYSDPNDLLVVRLLKDLEIINNEGEPAKHYDEFRNPDTTKKALARGLTNANKGLFEEYPHIHKSSNGDIKSTYDEVFREKKTDLIIKYISGTFVKLVSFIGMNTIDDLLAKSENTETQDAESHESAISEPVVNEEAEENHEAEQQEELATADEEEKKEGPLHSILGDQQDEEENEIVKTESQSEYAPAKANGGNTKASTSQNIAETYGDDEAKKDSDRAEAAIIDFEHKISKKAKENEAKSNNPRPTLSDNRDSNPINESISMEKSGEVNHLDLSKEDRLIQTALFKKFELVYKMERWEDLIRTADEIITRYDNDDHPELQDDVVHAITRRAEALLNLDRKKEALEPINDIIKRFSDSDNEKYYEQASEAMMLKAEVLEENGDSEVMTLYEQIINRFETNGVPSDNEKLDEIVLRRFQMIMEEENQTATAILDACSDLINRYQETDKHEDELYTAMVKRAETLDEMGKDEKALDAYNEFLSAFGY